MHAVQDVCLRENCCMQYLCFTYGTLDACSRASKYEPLHLQLMKMDMASLAGGGNTSTPPRASSNQRVQVLNMDNFIDTTNIEGRFEFSEFVRAYGKYLDEQLEVYNGIQWYQVSLSYLLMLRCTRAIRLARSHFLLLQVPCSAFQHEAWPQDGRASRD